MDQMATWRQRSCRLSVCTIIVWVLVGANKGTSIAISDVVLMCMPCMSEVLRVVGLFNWLIDWKGILGGISLFYYIYIFLSIIEIWGAVSSSGHHLWHPSADCFLNQGIIWNNIMTFLERNCCGATIGLPMSGLNNSAVHSLSVRGKCRMLQLKLIQNRVASCWNQIIL